MMMHQRIIIFGPSRTAPIAFCRSIDCTIYDDAIAKRSLNAQRQHIITVHELLNKIILTKKKSDSSFSPKPQWMQSGECVHDELTSIL